MSEVPSSPQLVASTNEWNIIWFRDTAYAVPKSLGPANFEVEADRSRVLANGGAAFASVAEAKAHATREEAAGRSSSPPQLVEATDNWNIVQFRNEAYLLPKSLGPADLTDDKDRARALASGAVVFSSAADAKLHALREEAVARANSPPKFIDTVGTWNIIWFKDAAYAVPKFLGPVDLKAEEGLKLAMKSGSVSFKTIPEAVSFAKRAL
jgi:hypothetical protein